jgi:Skp family chaperone for outer membrane proteins
MKKLTLALMATLAMGLAATAFAADSKAAPAPANTAPAAATTVVSGPRIGVIELGQVLKADPQMQALKKQLDKMSRNASVMSAADKTTLNDKISREQRDLTRMQQDYFQDAKTAQNEAMSKVLKRIDDVVAKVAKQQNLDLIFQRENVAYHSARVDITQAVITQMKSAS